MTQKRKTTTGEPREAVSVTDMTKGVYRRVYAGYLKGKRINLLSLEAEAWFWRVNGVVDDFGNTEADPMLLFTATVGRRSGVAVENVAGWLAQMVDVGLVAFYEIDGEQYLHVVGFGERQPAPRNGKRIRRVPASPWDIDGGNGSVDVHGGRADNAATEAPAGEPEGVQSGAGGVQMRPDASGGSDTHTHSEADTHTDSDGKPPTESSGEPVPAAASPSRAQASPEPAVVDPPVLKFECIGGKNNKAAVWHLTESQVADWQEQFPAVDVRAECRKALGWTQTKPQNRKTADGMKQFLWGWMKRSQNRGGTAGFQKGAGATTAGQNGSPLTAAERKRREAELALETL